MMPFVRKKDLKTLVVDFTSHCNAMCGNCSRNIDGVKVNPNMPLGHMDIDTWKNIVDNAKGIDEIIFNGSEIDKPTFERPKSIPINLSFMYTLN